MTKRQKLFAIEAAKRMDWQQVVMNGGPPCFYIENGRFCGRAERWDGHRDFHVKGCDPVLADHDFVSFVDLLKSF